MIDYQERLSGPLHINDILETVQMVAGKKSELLQLLELCFVEDARMAGNALWVGMHLSSADIQCFTPYADRFIDGSMIETTVTCRRLRLAMLERLALLARYGCVGFDELGHYTAQSLDTHGQRSYVKQNNVAYSTLLVQDGTLDACTYCNNLVGVDAL